MASSSSNPHVTLDVGEEEYSYPYPSHVCAPNFVTLKLSGRDKFFMWKTQMLCLLESHGMLGFIDGTLLSPQTSVSRKEKVGDHQTRQSLWRRSDALVKGWILGTLSEETLGFVLNRVSKKFHHQERINADFSSKDVWEELHTIYGPVVLPQFQVSDTLQDQQRAENRQRLYEATLGGRLWEVTSMLDNGAIRVIDKITNNGNTAIHVAVGTNRKPELLQKLLELIPENTQLLGMKNSDGSTPLHVAAIVGNTEAAEILMARNPELLFVKDNEGHTPLALALSNMHTQTSQFMLHHINTDVQENALFSGTSGDELLVIVISSKDFRLAYDLVERYGYRALKSDAVPMAIAQNFPCERGILEEFTRTIVVMGDRVGDVVSQHVNSSSDLCFHLLPGPLVNYLLEMFNYGIYWIIMLFPKILNLLVSPFIKERVRSRKDAIYLLTIVCTLILNNNDSSTYHHYYTSPILEATRQNAYQLVEYFVFYFPDAIWSTNEDGHNIIQYAVISRSEKVYNLLYQMSEHKNVYRTIKDSSGNNLLHLAARLCWNPKSFRKPQLGNKFNKLVKLDH